MTPFDPPLEREGFGLPAAPSAPMVPAFGGPMTAPPPQAPMMPAFGMPPQAAAPPARKAPGFMDYAAPIISLLAGRKDPAAIGVGLTAYLKGQDLRRQQIESQQERDQRKQLERAKFYQSVVQSAQTYDDEVALQNDLAALKPLADFYGVPLDGIRISDTKKAAKERALMTAAVETAIKQHGQDILNRDDVTLQLSDGRRVSMASARAVLGGGLTDASGKNIPVISKPDALTPNTPEEQYLAQFAKENGAKTFAELSTAKQVEGRQKWAESGRAAEQPQRVEGLLSGRPGFAFQKGTKFYDSDGKDVTAAFRPKETVSERQAGNGGGRSELVQAVLDNPELFDRLTAKQIGEIAPALSAAGFKGFGKAMNESAIAKVAESKSAIASLRDLRQVLSDNEQYIGPIAGFQALNPYSEARKAQAKIDLVKQRVGKALEGGVLRKEDEEKYKKILATLNDTPSTAISKVDGIIATLEKDLEVFIEEQRAAGRRVTSPAPPAKPGPSRIKSITPVK